MSVTPSTPRRALMWPDLVDKLARHAPDPKRLYLVGGMVRDALRGFPIHDYDLATPDDGLQVARSLANALGGAYYPVDPARRTGRALIPIDKKQAVVDVASFRGEDLLADLRGRDFTVNAMAVRLDHTDQLLDPLNGQHDLFDARVLRQCSPGSLPSDPIRALRAVRLAIQLRLRIEPETLATARAVSPTLSNQAGGLRQPERARDELVKMLAGHSPAAALRLLHRLGLLEPVCPFPLPPDDALGQRMSIVEWMAQLIAIISPARTDHTAANLILGVAVVVLDRYRRQLQEHLGRSFGDDRPLGAVALLGAFTPGGKVNPGAAWAGHLRLSRAEAEMLDRLEIARQVIPQPPVDARAQHRYYRAVGEAGVTGVLLALAEQQAARPPGDHQPEAWGALLEEVAAPLLDAFFRRHQQVVAPPPFLDGNALTTELGIDPGPRLGLLLERLAEEQAAGTIRTRKQALALARRLTSGKNSA